MKMMVVVSNRKDVKMVVFVSDENDGGGQQPEGHEDVGGLRR